MCKTECAREMARGRERRTYTQGERGVNERVGDYPGQRWPISPADAEEAIAFIRDLGNAIYKVVK
jgi:hypothetical protein